jgi:hypothetical protein
VSRLVNESPIIAERRAQSHARRALTHSWGDVQPLAALYCAPGVVLALALGLSTGQRGVALLAAAGAFSTGFGAFQRLTRLQIAPMLLAAVCMSLAIAAGTVASGDAFVDAGVVAVAAFALGLAASFGTGPWWVLLQGAVFLVIAGANPGDWHAGLSRAAVVMSGGIGQCALVTLLRRLAPAGFPPLTNPNAVASPSSATAWASEARRVVTPRAPEFRYAILLGLATGAAVLIARRLAIPNGYWAALTVLLVLRRGGAETLTRGAQRMAGTLAGAAAATLLVALLRPETVVLLVLIGTAAWCAYATQWVNYGTFSLSVTSYVAFLLALQGLPEAQVALHRVGATLLGAAIAAIALGVARIGRHARRGVARLRSGADGGPEPKAVPAGRARAAGDG